MYCVSKQLLVSQQMEILPVNDLDVALHNFVNKDDKMAFYSCVQYNLQETRVSYHFQSQFCSQPFAIGFGFGYI